MSLLTKLKKCLLDAKISFAIIKAQTGDQAAQIEAGKLLEKALELEPDNPKYHNNYANLLGGGGMFGQKAVAHMSRAIELDPQNANYWLNLGRIFHDALARELAAYSIGIAESIDPKARMIEPSKREILTKHSKGFLYIEGYSEEQMKELIDKAKEAYRKLWQTKSVPLKRGELEKFLLDLKGCPWSKI